MSVTGRVVVVGSVNVDLVAMVERLPAAGETVTDASFKRHQGGKGGNQAAAAARLGAPVAFVGAVGDDAFGEEARAALAAEGVDVTGLATVPGPTGVAVILVDRDGENVIAVAPGANAAAAGETVEAVLDRLAIGSADLVMASNEIPTSTVVAALRAARRAGATTILNPAPATGLDDAALAWATLVVPNEGELATLADRLDPGLDAGSRGPAQPPAPGTLVAGRARSLLTARADGPGIDALVVTMGHNGALVVQATGDPVHVPAPSVRAIDTVGAGDTFAGALATGLAEGRGLEAAVRRAVAAASLSTTRPGARNGMPTAAELDRFLADG